MKGGQVLKKKCKTKIIVRIIQFIIIIATIIITKIAINYAFLQRGYEAIGGEYLIPVLGFIIVLIIEDIYQSSKKRKIRKKGCEKCGNRKRNKK